MNYIDSPIVFTTDIELDKYVNKQKFIITCSCCGEKVEKQKVNIKFPLMCRKCTMKKSFEGKDWSERNRKSEKTKFEKYGDSHWTNSEKARQTYRNKTDEEKQSIKGKIRETNLEKYGCHPSCRTEQKEKTIKTCLERYGVEHVSQVDEFKKKYKETCIEKYGVDNTFKSDSIKEKIKRTNLVRYGCENLWTNHTVRNKCMQRYTFDGISFDSSWELYYYIYLSDNDIEFEYSPNVSFDYDGIRYSPDFIVERELQYIKGNQFFDAYNKMMNPYDSELNELYSKKYDCMLKNNVRILTKNDLKHVFDYVNEKYTVDYVRLFKNDIEFPYQTKLTKSNDSIIRYFHKSMYKANRNGFKSPYEAWFDKSIIKKTALNRLKYVGKCRPCDILYGFNVAKFAPKVSVFSPKLAKELITEYLSEFTTIFDPFSGFSGRMLGTVDCGKKYVGSDININHIEESNLIVNYKGIGKNVHLECKDIFDYEKTEFEALFTCPPYEDKEIWFGNEGNVIKNCDEWIDICIAKFYCKKYLFVVDDTEKYKDNIVKTIDNCSHFNNNKEYVILL